MKVIKFFKEKAYFTFEFLKDFQNYKTNLQLILFQYDKYCNNKIAKKCF